MASRPAAVLLAVAIAAVGGICAATWWTLFGAPAARRLTRQQPTEPGTKRRLLWPAPNYADRQVLFPSGLTVATVGALVPLALALLSALGADTQPAAGSLAADQLRAAPGVLSAAAVTVAAFGLLGYLDDRFGSTAARGFAGHLAALVRWRHNPDANQPPRIGTGAIKAVGGLAVALATTAWALRAADGLLGGPTSASVVDVVRGALLVALAANLANLFDRAPGRCTKVVALGWVALLVCTAIGADASTGSTGAVIAVTLGASAATVGAAVGLARSELREQHMMGDTGSNAVGAAVGFTAVVALGPSAQWVLLAVLVAANLSSEVVSFSRVIDAVRVLRYLDRFGAPYRR